jgi:predicted PurR-regulated permease PerM
VGLLALAAAMVWRMPALAGLPLLLAMAWWLAWPWRTHPLPRRLLLLITGLGLLQLSVQTWSVLFPFVFAFGVAYLLEPLIARLQPRLGRVRAAALVVLVFLALSGSLLALLIPVLVGESARLLAEVPAMAQSLIDWTRDHLPLLLTRAGITDGDVGLFLKERGPALLSQAFSWLSQGGQQALLWLGGLATSLLGLVLLPFLVYSACLALPRLSALVLQGLPPRWRGGVQPMMDELDRILAGYVRGQTLVCLAVALLTWLGLALVGVPYPLLLGLAAGLLNLVPYVGISLVFVISSIVAVFNLDPVSGLLKVSLVFLVVQSLEGWVISPRIVGKAVGLAPMPALFCLLFFGALFGIAGMVVALPLGAMLQYLLRILYTRHLASLSEALPKPANSDE